MSDFEPLEPTAIRHALDVGLARQGSAEFAYNHIDYRFGTEPNAIWARTYVETIAKVSVHNLEQHDIASDHVIRVLMYLAARFKTIEIFDPNTAHGYQPLPEAVATRVADYLDAHFTEQNVKIAGWDEPTREFKS